MNDIILIFDFGSQYTQLIARRLRELNVYCEIYPYNKFSKQLIDNHNTKGIILSGSPYSVNSKDKLLVDTSIIRGKLPILGICYGAQMLAYQSGANVSDSNTREYGRSNLELLDPNSKLFKLIPQNSQVWMSHGDTINKLPSNFKVIAKTNNIPVAAFKIDDEDTYGIQFHPEVYHSTFGKNMLQNFVLDICNCDNNWTSESFIETMIPNLQNKLKDDKVVLGLSGGVDSTVTATILNKAIGKNLTCIFVDNGLLRKNEFNNVLDSFKDMDLNIVGVDAKDLFYDALKGITDPEQKRKAIGKTFIDVFDAEAKKIKGVKWLAQGTIYPDVIESISVKGPSATIKSHHNVGGLPEKMNLKLVEPLRSLFKDEVRNVGLSLQIPKSLLNRHPFPGPGLAIRILGEVTPQKVEVLQKVDEIFINGLIEHKLYEKVWQAAAILLPIKSVGVMGDEKTYANTIALRAVNSIDGMTADWSRLPYEFLSEISNKIINNVKEVNRVVYDISSKPPATIEWE
ncbi:MAG: glutamine-hydrolyzing GMP synthase [Bacteroidales bacterium]|jgi:GMP synthase (glutamine-hydrolysing)